MFTVVELELVIVVVEVQRMMLVEPGPVLEMVALVGQGEAVGFGEPDGVGVGLPLGEGVGEVVTPALKLLPVRETVLSRAASVAPTANGRTARRLMLSRWRRMAALRAARRAASASSLSTRRRVRISVQITSSAGRITSSASPNGLWIILRMRPAAGIMVATRPLIWPPGNGGSATVLASPFTVIMVTGPVLEMPVTRCVISSLVSCGFT